MHDIIFHYPVTFVRRYYFVLLGISSLSHVGPKTDRSARADGIDSGKNKTSGIYQDIDLQKEKHRINNNIRIRPSSAEVLVD